MGMVDLDEIVETGTALLSERGYRTVNPYFIPHILVNMAAGHISLKYGLKVNAHFLKRHGPFVTFYFYCELVLISISYNYCSILTANKCLIETELTS